MLHPSEDRVLVVHNKHKVVPSLQVNQHPEVYSVDKIIKGAVQDLYAGVTITKVKHSCKEED